MIGHQAAWKTRAGRTKAMTLRRKGVNQGLESIKHWRVTYYDRGEEIMIVLRTKTYDVNNEKYGEGNIEPKRF